MDINDNSLETAFSLLQQEFCNKRVLPSKVSEHVAALAQESSIRDLFDLKSPEITNLSDILEVSKPGKVYAIRMDLNDGADNHKKYVVASLILRGILTGRLSPETDTLIDAGNYNSARALRFYCERFGLKGMYVMSKLFPENILALLRTENFSIIRSPNFQPKNREAEFYEHLYNLMRQREFRKNKFCLWHAKYGGEVTKWLGEEIYRLLPELPQSFVSCLGAGSTLEGIQIPIKKHTECSIVVPEHEMSPLFSKIKESVHHAAIDQHPLKVDNFFLPAGIPHAVIGPHFDKINPLLSQDSIAEIDEIILYGDKNWKGIATLLMNHGISVGNSSAANLACAKTLADHGQIVLTIIFEPQRRFYISGEDVKT